MSQVDSPRSLGPSVAHVIGAYGIVILGAGHGALPAVLLLLMGTQEVLHGREMDPGLGTLLATGWLGVAALGLTLLPPIARRARWLLLLGVVSLVASLAMIVMKSEVAALTLATGIPFLVLSALLLYRAARSSTPAPPPVEGSAG